MSGRNVKIPRRVSAFAVPTQPRWHDHRLHYTHRTVSRFAKLFGNVRVRKVQMEGMSGFGSVGMEENEPTFHEPWEAVAFGLNVLCIGIFRAYNTDEYRHSAQSAASEDVELPLSCRQAKRVCCVDHLNSRPICQPSLRRGIGCRNYKLRFLHRR